MTNPDIETMAAWQGRTMIDRNGDKLGDIKDIYLDNETGRPEWALVSTGLFGTRSTFVPLGHAVQRGDQLQVPYDKGQVKDAPGVEPDGQLSEDEEARLYRHYGLDYDTVAEPRGREAAAGRERGGRGTDQAMTRSEEELEVGTRQRERGRARLRKYVVTEQVTQTVPVQREEVRLEREPITDANFDAATRGPAISEEEHEVTLREEEPVVSKRVVPKERVRVDTDVVTEEREVGDEVRKERIDYEGDVEPRDTGRR